MLMRWCKEKLLLPASNASDAELIQSSNDMNLFLKVLFHALLLGLPCEGIHFLKIRHLGEIMTEGFLTYSASTLKTLSEAPGLELPIRRAALTIFLL